MTTRIGLGEAVERARTVAGKVAGPLAVRTDGGVWPEEALQALFDAGLGGLVVPVPAGGHGLGLRALAGVCETLGEGCASTAICYGMHVVASAVIAAKATPTQTADLLEPIAAGRHLTTLALSEPGTGAHFWLPQTTLTRDGAGFRVSGTKSFVTNGGRADSYVVSTVGAEPDIPVGQFSCVVVPAGAPGLSWQGAWDGIGMRGNSSRSLVLEGVPVPFDHLLGEVGDQIWYVFEVVAPYFLVAMAGTYLGVAVAALSEARHHLRQRRYSHTGRPLAAEPVLQHRVGCLYATVERTRRLLYFAAEEADAGGPMALPALASAKAEVAGCVVEVTNEAMTLVGDIGYRERCALERHLRDARAAPVMSPTTDILRLWAGRALLDLPLLAE